MRLLQGARPREALIDRVRNGAAVDAAGSLAVRFDGPPVIRVQPTDLAAHLATPAAFGLAVEGAFPFSYQWFRDDSYIAGATGPVLRFVEVTDAEAGRYSVRVTNPVGAVTSTTVTLSLLPAWPITTWAGDLGRAGTRDGPGREAAFHKPSGLAFDPRTGGFYVTDFGNNTIRYIAPDRRVTTVAGRAETSGSVDGQGESARLDGPVGIAAGSDGAFYFTDFWSHTVRRMLPDGTVTTVAGAAGQPGSTDGQGAAARFRQPMGIAADAQGNLYVGEWENRTVRKIDPAGRVTTFAGRTEEKGWVDGPADRARFGWPRDLAVDAVGMVHVADAGNRAIRRVAPNGQVSTVVGRPDLCRALNPRQASWFEGRRLRKSQTRAGALQALFKAGFWLQPRRRRVALSAFIACRRKTALEISCKTQKQVVKSCIRLVLGELPWRQSAKQQAPWTTST